MKKQKRTLIGLIICVIIIIIVILLILFSQHSKEISNEEEDNLERKDEIVSDIIVGSNSLPRTNNIKLYYTVDECLKSYFTILKVKIILKKKI